MTLTVEQLSVVNPDSGRHLVLASPGLGWTDFPGWNSLPTPRHVCPTSRVNFCYKLNLAVLKITHEVTRTKKKDFRTASGK